MANVLTLSICLVLILSGVESCLFPTSKYIYVPQNIQAGDQITTVDVSGCDTKSAHLSVDDQSFTIGNNGEIVAVSAVHVEERGRTFSVLAPDNSGLKPVMEVHLVPSADEKKERTGQAVLRRSKRRWSPPPFNILENDPGPYPRDIERIVSDSASTHDVYYTFSGPGFNEHPVGVFTLNRDTGMLTVHKAVDREEFPSFTLTTKVFDKKTNQPTDDPLPITILVDDVNDNAPTFEGPLQYVVQEKCNAGTPVGQIKTSDRDQQGTLHVKVRYTLLSGLDLFKCHPETGVISTVTNTLDREVKDKYTVVIQIKDMDGASSGLSNTGTATISVGDINDNPPTFTKASYDVTVKENESNKLILRIPVEDKDLVGTPNWISKFVITKGNENGNFRIETDNKTNEGLLYLVKPLDHEQMKNLKLEIMAKNEAELADGNLQWLSIPVEVTVANVDEGPQFTAPTVRFTVKENTPNGTVIGSYTAIDPETKSSDGINYYKVSDPGSWISINKNTGELRVANTIDRESTLVHDGIYNVTVKAVDASSKTGTGTVIIAVEDVNDNMPTVPSSELVLCEKEGQLGSVLVVAEDKDQSPLSSPFSFSLPPDNDGKWAVGRFNDTAATLKQMKELPTGIYNVPVDIKDLQGYGKTQTVKVRICQCRNGACLAKESSVTLGPLGILTLLLPLALLLLLGLLLAFFCVTKREKLDLEDMGDSGGILLKSNTEAPGEEVDSSLITVPTIGVDPVVKGSAKNGVMASGWIGNKSASTIGGQSVHDTGIYKSGIVTADMQDYYTGHYEGQYGQQFVGGQPLTSCVDIDNMYLAQDSALHHTWQTNGRYLQQKLAFMGTEEDGRYADDIIHGYGFEGAGSAAGSVGCCSDYGDNGNLDFLNTLGPKFKTLADVCTKT